jgi:hypothetical protein
MITNHVLRKPFRYTENHFATHNDTDFDSAELQAVCHSEIEARRNAVE